MNNRLPQLPPSTDSGFVYVVHSNLDKSLYKIGFSRAGVERRARDAEGVLLFTIPTGQQPCVLEHLIHQRFKSKQASDIWGREWFSLNADDLVWLRGLVTYCVDNNQRRRQPPSPGD